MGLAGQAAERGRVQGAWQGRQLEQSVDGGTVGLAGQAAGAERGRVQGAWQGRQLEQSVDGGTVGLAGGTEQEAGRDLGHRREAECWTHKDFRTYIHSVHTFNGLTLKGVRDQLKRTKTQVK